MQSTENELPTPEEAFEWPRSAMREGNWSLAAKRWSVLRKAYKEKPIVWFQGVTCHIEAGELDKADSLLQKSKEKFPNHPYINTDSAILALHQNDISKAKEYSLEARNHHPNLARTWIVSAEIEEKSGNHDAASEYYRKACDCETELPGSYIKYAEHAMRLEEWEEALARWEVVRKKFPKIATAYTRAAEAARQLGDYKYAHQLTLSHQYGQDDSKTNTESEAELYSEPRKGSIGRLTELIWTKSLFNLRSEVQRNYLSYAWWILEPLLYMVVYYVVFGVLLNRGIEDFPVFLLTGLIPWMWFMKIVSGSSNSLLAGQNLMLQVGLPSIVFPFVVILQNSLKQIPVFILLVGFVWFNGYKPDMHWLGLMPIIAVQLLLTIAISCLVAAVIPFIRDLSYLVPTGLTFLMFMSGIFYDYKMIPVEWQQTFLLNPIAFLLKSYREVFIYGIHPDFEVLMWWGITGIFLCIFSILLYQRLRYIFPRIIME